MVIRISASH